jgi:molybdopterin/thiamine biosynthesis adenylyltransferase
MEETLETKEEEVSHLNLSRQALLVPYKDINQYTVKVFGVGSVGSHLIKILAKTGFKNIEAYDMDKVEEENISAQAFDFRHIGMNKVDAIKEICKESAGVDITAIHGEISGETQINAEPNTVYCCVFDSFEARKLLFDKLKSFPVIFIDGRIGQFNLRHYLINCAIKEEVARYEATLQKSPSELKCGEKACAPINVELAGKMVMNIVNFAKGKDYVKTFIGNAEAPANDVVAPVIREKQEEAVEIQQPALGEKV